MKHSFLQSIARLLATIVVLVVPGVTWAQCGGRWLTGPEHVPPGLTGPVYALAVMPNGDVIAGGQFSTGGGLTPSYIARWNGASWMSLGTGTSNVVRALAVMPNGDLIAAGGFANAGDQRVNFIARWDGTSWSALGSGMGGTNSPFVVESLCVLPSGELVAGGDFTTAGGVTANRIAIWNGSEWAPLGLGASGSVRALAAGPDGSIIAGGNFLTAGSVRVNHIARWDGASWNSLGGGMDAGGASSYVYALAVMPDGDLVAGGAFSVAGGQAARSIARWNGSVWAPLGPGAASVVNSLCVSSNGDIIAGVSGASSLVRRWDGSSWSDLGTVLPDRDFQNAVGVNALIDLPNGDIIAGGNFGSVDGLWTNFIARWGGSSWTSLGAGLGGQRTAYSEPVLDLATMPNGDLIAGGIFTTAGGMRSNNIARWDGSRWTPIGSGSFFHGYVYCLGAMSNGDLMVGDNYGGSGRVTLWNGFNWTQIGSTGGSISSFAELPNGDMVVGGEFQEIGGVAAANIARWDGATWAPLGPGMNAPVLALAVMPNGDLVAGGEFTSGGAATANGVARWDGSSWTPFGSGMNGSVQALAVMPNGDLVATGWFSTAGGVTARNIARWDGSAWAPLGSGLSDSASGVYGAMSLAVLPDGSLAAGGDFRRAGALTVNGIARWDGSAWSGFGTGVRVAPLFGVFALAVHHSGELIAGGTFKSVGGVVSASFARWSNTGIPWVAQPPRAQSGSVRQVVTIAATCASGYDFDGPVEFRWQRDGVDIADGPGGASANGGIVSGAAGTLPSPPADSTVVLTIGDTQPSDAGGYTVIFSNSCGSGASAAAMLTVTGLCPADFNSDGGVDSDDVIGFFGAWDTGAPTADFNTDGVVDGDDMIDFFAAWDVGC